MSDPHGYARLIAEQTGVPPRWSEPVVASAMFPMNFPAPLPFFLCSRR